MKCPKCGRTRLDTYCPKTQTRCEENIRQVISNLHTLEYLPPFLTSDRILIREEAKRIMDKSLRLYGTEENRDPFTQWLYNMYKSIDAANLRDNKLLNKSGGIK